VPKAIDAFLAAIELDPSHAPAHAGLALSYCAAATLRVVPPADSYRQAREAALRALAMDASCSDAQVALAEVLFLSEWNWMAAERSLQRALDADPGHPAACLLYGRLLEALGRLDEGLAIKLRALEREPLSALVHLQISLSYWNQHRFDDSIAWANKALAIDPTHLLAREHLAGAYWALGDFERHMEESFKHAQAYGVPSSALDPIRKAFADGGRPAVVRCAIQAALERPHPAADVQLSILYAETGDLTAAFNHLDRALDARDPCLVHLAVAPQWDRLRHDPRYTRCVSRMGLTPVPTA
jgi:tetratricopeptide (TPR) repeat protein